MDERWCLVRQDGTVRVWDAESGSAVGEPLRGHEGIVLGVAVSADGRIAVSGSADWTVRVWDVESGNLVGQLLRGHEDTRVFCGDKCGRADGGVRFWGLYSEVVGCGKSESAVGGPLLHGHEDRGEQCCD